MRRFSRLFAALAILFLGVMLLPYIAFSSEQFGWQSLATAYQDVDMHVAKYLDSGTGAPGAEMRYRIYFSNQGDAPAHDVVLTDTLPISTTYVLWYGSAYNPFYIDLDQTITPIVTGDQIVWNLGQIEAGGYGYVYLTVYVSDVVSVGSVLTNTASISTSDDDVDPGDNESTHALTVPAPTRDMYVEKYLSGNPGAPGGFVAYNISFQNQGTLPAQDVVITDTLPVSVTYGGDYVGYSGFTTVITGNTVVFTRSTVNAGESGNLSLWGMVAETANAGDVLTNVVQIATSDTDVDSSDDIYTHTTTLVAPWRDMYVEKSLSGSQGMAGDEIEYRISFSNQGNSLAHDVILTDTLPVSVTYVSWNGYVRNPDNVDLDQTITPTMDGNQIVWDLGQIVGGEMGYIGQGEIYLRVRITDTASGGDVLTNVVEITASSVDTDLSDNVYTHTTTVASHTRDMYVSKYLNGDPAPSGGEMQYWISFSNQGNSPARDVVLTDTLPANVTYVSWYGDAWNPDWVDLDQTITPVFVGNQISWNLGQIEPNGSGSIYLRVHVADTASAGDVLTNVVGIETSDTDINPNNDVYTRTTTVAPFARDMNVSKSLSGNPAPPGGEMQYYISFRNQGNSPARDVVITDTLPVSVTYVSWYGYAYNPWVDLDQTITPIFVGNQVVWNLGQIEPNGYGYIYLRVRIADSANIGDVLTNEASISTSDVDVDPGDDISTLNTTVAAPTRDMYVSKSPSGSPGAPGTEMQYQIYFSSQGNSPARDVVITDTLPVSVTYVSWYGSAYNPWMDLDQNVTPVFVGNQVVWNLGQIESNGYGYIYLRVRIADAANIGDVLTNEAVISTSDVDVDPGDNVSTLNTTVAAPMRDMSVQKWLSGDPGAPGTEMQYQIYFRNDGNVPARDVIITDTLPVSLTLVSWSGYIDDPYYSDLEHLIVPIISGNQIVWHLGEVPAGQYGYIYPRLRVVDTANVGDPLVNVVSVSTSDVDVDPSDNVYTHTTSVSLPTRDMYVEKYLDVGPAVAGNQIQYEIDFWNQGNSTASGIMLTDTLPISTSYVSWYGSSWNPRWSSLNDGITIEVIGNQIVWHLDPMVSDGDGYIYLTAHVTDTVNAGDVLVNEVSISTSDTEADPSDNTDTLATTVVAPARDMSVEKWLNGSPGTPGGEMEYTIYFFNDGTAPAQNVVITDTLPAGLTYVSWDGYAYTPYWVDLDQAITPVVNGNQIVWNLGQIQVPPDGYGYIHLQVRVAGTMNVGDELQNVVSISASGVDVNTSNNVYTHTTTVSDPARDMYVDKYMPWDREPGAPGGEMEYAIYFHNQGNWTASNVILTDTLPANTTFVSWSGYIYNPNYENLAQTISATISGNQVVWDLGAVVADGYGYIYPVVRIDGAAQVRDELTNEVRIFTSDVDTDPSDNTDEYTTRVLLPWKDLYIEKWRSGPVGTPGGDMRYGIYFSNRGNQSATNTIVTDTLPPGASLVSWYGYTYNNPDYVDLDQTISATISGDQVVWNIASLLSGAYGYIYPTVHIPGSAVVGERMYNVVRVSSDEADWDTSDDVYTHSVHLAAAETDVGVYKSINNPTSQQTHGSELVREEMERLVAARQRSDQTRDLDPRSDDDADRLPLRDRMMPDSDRPNENNVHDTRTFRADEVRDAPDNVPMDMVLHRDQAHNLVATSDGQVSAPGSIIPGGEIEYRIYFSNSGNQVTPDVVVTDTLPAGVTFVSWSGYLYNPDYVDLDQTISATVSGDQIIWDLGSLVAGGYGYIYPVVHVPDTTNVGTELVNQAEISTSDVETNLVNNTSFVTATVEALVPLAGVTISGETEGTINTAYTFVATVSPSTATTPINYVWSPAPDNGQGTAMAIYTWPTTGTRRITVTATNEGNTVTDTHTIIIIGPPPCVGLNSVEITGRTGGYTDMAYTFNAVIQPSGATPSIAYTWSPEPDSGQNTASASYSWTTAGAKTISVEADNCGGPVNDTHGITIGTLVSVSVTIDQGGGVLIYTDTQGLTTTVNIPANAVSETTTLVYTPLLSPTHPISSNQRFAYHAFGLKAKGYPGGTLWIGFVFSRPVTITIHYSDDDVMGIDEDSLRIYYWTGTVWADAANTCTSPSTYTNDPDRNILRVPICHLTQFSAQGIVWEGNLVYLPLVLRNN